MNLLDGQESDSRITDRFDASLKVVAVQIRASVWADQQQQWLEFDIIHQCVDGFASFALPDRVPRILEHSSLQPFYLRFNAVALIRARYTEVTLETRASRIVRETSMPLEDLR